MDVKLGKNGFHLGFDSQQKTSRDGYSFSVMDDFWELDKQVTLSTKVVKQLLDESLVTSHLKVLSYFAQNYSAAHTQNLNNSVVFYLREMHTGVFKEDSLISFRSRLAPNTQYRLGVLRVFLKKWFDLGEPGISSELEDPLQGWKIKGNAKGEVVKQLDPKKGPLSDIELQAFNEGVAGLLENKKIGLAEASLALCVSHTGRRPIQISHLKICDLLLGTRVTGKKVNILRVPRAKQRNQAVRSLFTDFAVTESLFNLLKAQAKAVQGVFKQYYKLSPEPTTLSMLPLFPSAEFHTRLRSGQLDIGGLDLHLKADSIQGTLMKVVELGKIHSERTGELLEISPMRFRYTIGTRAAREGFGDLVIAELLDHSDTQNAGVYIENIPDHVEKIDEAVGRYMAPYAQAFAGVLVDSEQEAVRGHDPRSRVRNERANLGTCGNFSFCGAGVPVPCYTCNHFQPWLDGPHEEVLQNLLNERNRITELTGDLAIASINDRSILAVTEVINRCRQRREALSNG